MRDQNKILAIKHPHLAEEWHPNLNGEKTPFEVTAGSDKKAWWQCSVNPIHEWQARISNRAYGRGCPSCTREKISPNNSLQALHPELAFEWHPILNGEKLPGEVSYGSGRYAWWVCSEGHEYISEIKQRVHGTGCPYCSGRRVSKENSLYNMNQELAMQWHPTKNGKLTPLDVTAYSSKRAWWICDKGHEWPTEISNRSVKGKGRGCPKCAKKRMSTNLEIVITKDKTHYLVKDVMEILRISNWQLLEFVKKGEIPAQKVEKKYIFLKSDIDELTIPYI